MIHDFSPNFLPGLIKLTLGRASDYHALARFHYAPRPPATFAAVVCAYWRRAEPAADATAWQSFVKRNDAINAQDDPVLIAVAVLSYPSQLHRTRHRVFGLKPIPMGHRLRWVNSHLRTISRVVIHPQFRGIGLSTPLIRAAVDLCPTTYVEASARMGRAHPLFDRAGFTRVNPAAEDEPVYYWCRRDTPFPSPASLPTSVASG